MPPSQFVEFFLSEFVDVPSEVWPLVRAMFIITRPALCMTVAVMGYVPPCRIVFPGEDMTIREAFRRSALDAVFVPVSDVL